MATNENNFWRRKDGPVAWLGLGVGIVALLMTTGVLAELRGDSVVDVDRRAGNGEVRTVEEITIGEIKNQIIQLGEDLDEEVETESLTRRIEEIRVDIAAAYQRTNEETRNELEELDRELEEIEDGIRSNTASALAELEELISRLREEINNEVEG